MSTVLTTAHENSGRLFSAEYPLAVEHSVSGRLFGRYVYQAVTEIEEAAVHFSAIVVELHHVIGQMREVARLQIVAHRRARAACIDVGCRRATTSS